MKSSSLVCALLTVRSLELNADKKKNLKNVCMKLLEQSWQQNQLAYQSKKSQVMQSVVKNLAPSFENP